MHSIGTIISYCTNDYRFIGKCIAEARHFSKQIIVPVSDHFFDGTPENRLLLNRTYAQNPDCLFVEFSYLPDRIYSRYHTISPDDEDWAIFWAATTRYIGLHYLDPSIDYILFLDSDEIVQGVDFLSWFSSKQYLDAQRLASYFYALKPNLRAKNVVNLPFLVKKETLAPLTLINELERIGAYQSHPGPKREGVVGLNGLPLVHHYSWVRTKEECLHKAKTWGHRNDENWTQLIDDTFNGKTHRIFGSTHEFEEISQAYFNPFDIVYPKADSGSAVTNVIKINDRDLMRKEIEYAFF